MDRVGDCQYPCTGCKGNFSEIFRDFRKLQGSRKLQVTARVSEIAGNSKELGKLPGDLGKLQGNIRKGHGTFPGLVSNISGVLRDVTNIQ
jgi:hypothetical protein